MAKEQLQELMRRNDMICLEMGLPVFEATTQPTRGMGGAEYHTALKGQSWKLRLMNTIDECMKYAADKDAFVSLMESEGYAVRWESGRKYITYTTPDGLKCRDNKLHEEKYCKEAMEREFRIRAKLVQRKSGRYIPLWIDVIDPLRNGGIGRDVLYSVKTKGAHFPI